MERKRSAEGAPVASPPPRKAPRIAAASGKPQDVEVAQRAQLAARIQDQERELEEARLKISQAQDVFAQFNAVPLSACQHMRACIEDLQIVVARARGVDAVADDEVVDPSGVPLAAALLETEVTAGTLAEQPARLKKVTAQIMIELERLRAAAGKKAEENNANESENEAADAALKDLHVKFRMVSDQLDDYSRKDKERKITVSMLKDEVDEQRSKLDMSRRKIVSLDTRLSALRSLGPDAAVASAVNAASQMLSGGENGVHAGDGYPEGFLTPGDESKLTVAQRLAEERLDELRTITDEKKALASELHELKLALAERSKSILPAKDVQASSLYKSMEATLQHVLLREKSCEAERKAETAERDEERSDASKLLDQTKAESQREVEELRRQVEELRKVAHSSKAEKDQWAMTYQAGKVDSSNASHQVAAAQERRAVSAEAIRDKLRGDCESLRSQVTELQERVVKSELRVIKSSDSSPDVNELVERLERDITLKSEKCSEFMAEVEMYTNLITEAEDENRRLNELLRDKEAVLSRVQRDKLSKSHALSTKQEEVKYLEQGRQIDREKIKKLTQEAASSKWVVHEASQTAAKASEESRVYAAQLAKQKAIAEEATLSARKAIAEKEELAGKLESAVAEGKSAREAEQSDSYDAKRLREENDKLKVQLDEAIEQKDNESLANGGTVSSEMADRLMRKLQCSVVPNQWKEVVLARCGHMMSKKCIEEQISRRSRKCPLCRVQFSDAEVISVFL